MPRAARIALLTPLLAAALLLTACATSRAAPGRELERRGDEIVVAGRYIHTGTPVVLWTDPGGYDHYRIERRFVPIEEASWEHTQHHLDSPHRFGLRTWPGMSEHDIEAVRGGGWTLEQLQQVVDQFVIHYDVCGVSRQCFNVLHDHRGLSVHFLLDIDGTIYQTMDLKERGWHATRSNTRSVGVEIANMGAYGSSEQDPFDTWYATDDAGRVRITVPARLGDGGVRTPGFVGHPDRNALVIGEIQGRTLRQYDLTPQQYEALARLTAALNRALPKIELEAPRDAQGYVIPHVLTDEQWEAFQGVIGHYHIQSNKVDPGPAFQWDRVLEDARRHRARMPDAPLERPGAHDPRP